MLSTEEILENAARDGSLEVSEWPRVLEGVLKKLHDIVHNDFPLPSAPLPTPIVPSNFDPEVVALTPPPVTEDDEREQDILDISNNDGPTDSQSSSKENDAPADSRPPVPGFSASSHFPVQPPDNAQTGALPPDLLSLYNSTTRILTSDFAQSPPYTIQRLAEMVMHPTRHYRFLPAYLRALDRIVSVSSPISDFPLPTLNASQNAGGNGFLTNGDSNQSNGTSEKEGLGSDESLGGALLTPIPWLKNPSGENGNASANEGELHSESTETIEGPNGAGSIETVSVTVNGVPSATSLSHTNPAPTNGSNSNTASPTLSEQSDASSSSSISPDATPQTDTQLRQQGAVTQGELLRQEQEAGVVPISQQGLRRTLLAGAAAAHEGLSSQQQNQKPSESTDPENTDDALDERPHARGPDVIGVEDMGPQPASSGPTSTSITGADSAMSTAEDSEAISDIAQKAQADDSGAPGQDPSDLSKEVEKLKSAIGEEQQQEAKDGDGDVVIADADGEEKGVDEKEG